ncbi:hypothetical protein PAHAL_1G074000 [Panicum hallii]|uniref:Uncharacterized protein n=1 Tax=Panicum hallii TaxID=206008 RepID=A0A2S3GM59_9POAL|nr:uncharacterized protein LOC112877123 [Panicum hallii]PAN04545.1 hypothetical protein PAHAL_1G074000 [Panicum hallii]
MGRGRQDPNPAIQVTQTMGPELEAAQNCKSLRVMIWMMCNSAIQVAAGKLPIVWSWEMAGAQHVKQRAWQGVWASVGEREEIQPCHAERDRRDDCQVGPVSSLSPQSFAFACVRALCGVHTDTGPAGGPGRRRDDHRCVVHLLARCRLRFG